MFARIKSWFNRYTDLKNNIAWNEERILSHINSIKEDILILKKTSHQREIKIIESPVYLNISLWGGSGIGRDETMQKERDKLRAEGFSFCHKKESGDEIWVKY